MAKYWIRHWDDPNLVPASATDSIIIVFIEYSPRDNDARNVTVGGIALGAQQVTIKISTSKSTINTQAAVAQTTGHFEATLQVPCSEIAVPIVIEASNIGLNLTGTDRASAILQDSLLDELPKHSQFDLVLGRLNYAAGQTDRFHFTRNFVKYDVLPPWWRMIRGFSDGNSLIAINQQKLSENIEPKVHELVNNARSGKISLDQYNNELREVLTHGLFEVMEEPTDSMAAYAGIMYRIHTLPLKELFSGSKGKKLKRDLSDARTSMGGGHLIITPTGPGAGKFRDKIEDAIEDIIKFSEAHRRLGILYYNRMRIRPTQLVVGEPVYQLALAPGEEVQIRQTTETKQKSSFTEIRDQESERENTFSSTWSTDLSSSLSTSSSFQHSTQLGAGVDGTIPETPIGVNANASASFSDASDLSQESSVQENLQKTASISAKMRSQHKVQIEITNERSSAFSSTRTLRNTNQFRSLHHTFYKVYRKEQVTLERYDAKLCFRLQVPDPANFTRDGFLVGLNKIDPDNTELYGVVPPTGTTHRKEFTKDAPPFRDTVFRWTNVARWVELSGDLKQIAGLEAQGRDLSSFEFIMTRRSIFYDGEGKLHSTTGYEASDVVDVESTGYSPISNVKVDWSFSRLGGEVRWEIKPNVRKQKTQFALRINMPVIYDNPPLPGVDFGYTALTSVTFEIRTAWHPSGQTMEDYYKAMLAEKRRLTSELDAQMIYDLYTIAESDYPNSVIHRALGEQLDFPQDFDVAHVKDIFDLDGVVIESVPYWGDPLSADNYTYLVSRLKSLPINLDLHRIVTDPLVASRAIVYLPIKAGQEESALNLLEEARESRVGIANNFDRFRNSRFDLVTGLTLPLVDELTAPMPTLATTASVNSAWVYDWEKPQRAFEVLGQWSEVIPTDGIHMETHLSHTSVADERARAEKGD